MKPCRIAMYVLSSLPRWSKRKKYIWTAPVRHFLWVYTWRKIQGMLLHVKRHRSKHISGVSLGTEKIHTFNDAGAGASIEKSMGISWCPLQNILICIYVVCVGDLMLWHLISASQIIRFIINLFKTPLNLSREVWNAQYLVTCWDYISPAARGDWCVRITKIAWMARDNNTIIASVPSIQAVRTRSRCDW